ncbi:MAG: hypothetical protein KA314_09035 [Chloroflexi bacterium]|nr:hypothetical protein [Chloroflexota bacterium]MBP8055974.1 hypothetical protein [Chloroflexota bacterium]
MATNLLHNGDFSGAFQPYRKDERMTVAASWAPWWTVQRASDPQWKNQTPVFRAAALETLSAQEISSPWATHTAGLYQQVPAAPGDTYKLTVEALAWSSEDETPGNLVEPSNVDLQIGIDPTGGLDPNSPLIVWSKKVNPLGKWETLELSLEAETSIITVFLKSAPERPKRQQSIFWRMSELIPVSRYRRTITVIGAGDTHINLEPEKPLPGTEMTALVSSNRNQVFMELTVQRPDGEYALVAFQGMTQENDRFTWRYRFHVPDEGLYDIRFIGDRGARLLAQQLLSVKHDDLSKAAALKPKGDPRIAYRRIYVLLPPTADEKWLIAAAKGSFTGRYTVGYSADDAGLGLLEKRQVLAINPHHWPTPLTAGWFHDHYPGTLFTAIVANTPADLEAWLRKWVPSEE